MWDWTFYAAMLLVMFAGLCLATVAVPGALWLMLAAAIGYSALTGFDYLRWWELLILLGLCLLAEAVEFLAGAGGARKAGGSRRAGVGAVVGGLLGGALLSIPVPILGTIAGVLIGAFCGAMAVELLVRQDKEVSHSARVGYKAAIGTLIGIVTKMTIGVLVLLLTAFFALPLGGREQPATNPTTGPSTTSTAPATVPTLGGPPVSVP